MQFPVSSEQISFEQQYLLETSIYNKGIKIIHDSLLTMEILLYSLLLNF